MVARPSLKRVVPGSVPPWRALCAESARALKAFFSVLCVSKSVLLLESKFGQILRALNLRAFWVRPSRTRARFLLRARVFFVAPSLFRATATFLVAAPWFPLPAIKKARQPFVIITLEHFRGRNAFGFARRRTSKLVGRCS